MDRVVVSSKHGHVGAASWKRSATVVIAEVLCGGRTAEGISVDAEALCTLPHTVLLSDEVATIYEF